MSRYRAPIKLTEEERAWIDPLPRPHLLLMIGGPIRYWNITPRHISSVIAHLLERAGRLRGSLIVIGSPRTPRAVLQRARRELEGVANARLAEAIPRFQILMQDADELFPTGDSVSMISESVISCKPVAIVRPNSRVSRRIMLGPERRMAINPFRDLRRFWTYLQRQGLAGTIEEPLTGMIDNPVVRLRRPRSRNCSEASRPNERKFTFDG